MKHPSPTVIALIAANALLFILTYFVPGQESRMIDLLALHYPSNEAMKPWQFVTHMFMHGGATHIIFNMIGIYLFGSPLEQVWGRRRFLIFYFVSGLGAGLIYTAVNMVEFNSIYGELVSRGVPAISIQRFLETSMPNASLIAASTTEELRHLFLLYNSPMLGASGALYGILVAFAILFPNVKLALLFFPVPIAAKYFVPIIVLIDLFSGLTGISLFGGGVAHFAHIGGALIGFALMTYWKSTVPPRRYYYG